MLSQFISSERIIQKRFAVIRCPPNRLACNDMQRHCTTRIKMLIKPTNTSADFEEATSRITVATQVATDAATTKQDLSSGFRDALSSSFREKLRKTR